MTRDVVFRMQRGHNVFCQIDTEATPKARAVPPLKRSITADGAATHTALLTAASNDDAIGE